MCYRSKKIKKILILSPELDQSIAIARYILKYSDVYALHGGFLHDEQIKKIALFDKVLKIEKYEQLHEYDIVLPTGTYSTYWMIKGFKQFKVSGISYTSQNLQCFDKLGFLKTVGDLGFLIPKTFISIDHIDISFPIFYKPKFEHGTGSRGIAYTSADFNTLNDLDNLIFQEYIPGRSTYGVGFIAQSGEFLTTFVHEEFLSQPIQGGSAVCIKRFEDQRLIEYTKQIVKHTNFSGWGLAEYKYCHKRKDYVFMEVNAKLWASIEFALMNNNKFLKYLFGLDYRRQRVNSAVFIDRLLLLGILGWFEFFKTFKFVGTSKIISYRNYIQLLKTLLRNTIP